MLKISACNMNFTFLNYYKKDSCNPKIRMRECENNQIYAGIKSKINVPVQ